MPDEADGQHCTDLPFGEKRVQGTFAGAESRARRTAGRSFPASTTIAVEIGSVVGGTKKGMSPTPEIQRPPVRQHILTWSDLPDCAAVFSFLIEDIDQCSIQVGGHEQATLLLFREHLGRVVEIQFARATEPDDTLLLAIGRTIVAHQTECDHGGHVV